MYFEAKKLASKISSESRLFTECSPSAQEHQEEEDELLLSALPHHSHLFGDFKRNFRTMVFRDYEHTDWELPGAPCCF